MATYAIGDVQGCFASFQALLAQVRFDPAQDRLWLVGDLVNRGPDSLGVLRWVKAHDACVRMVLGNHDLHLLAMAAGARAERRGDTLNEVLQAPDCEELLVWLRDRPFFYREDGFAMVHAGIHPAWSWNEVEAWAAQLATDLRSGGQEIFAAMTAGEPMQPSWEKANAARKFRIALAAFTRMRMVLPDGSLDMEFTGHPDAARPGNRPWFVTRQFADDDPVVLFGHWAALNGCREAHAWGLDTGCVWGKTLTAVRLDDGVTFSQPAVE